MCVYTQNFLETWSYKLAVGGRWAFIPLVTCEAASLEDFLTRQLRLSRLGPKGAPALMTPLPSHPEDPGWLEVWQLLQWWWELAFPTLPVSSTNGSSVFPSSSPRRGSQVCLPSPFLLCAVGPTLPGSAVPLQHSCHLPAPRSLPPPSPAAPCLTQQHHQNHNLSEPLSSTNKGQICLTFPSEFPTLSGFSSIFLSSFPPSLLLPLQIFSFCTFFSFTLGSGLN